MVTQKSQQDELEKLRKVFQTFDIDKNGFLEPEEIEKAYEKNFRN